MRANIEKIEVIGRENQVSYVVLHAAAIQGDTQANIIDANGFVNFAANMSRRTQFVKTLFPATEAQAQAWLTVQANLATQPVWINLNYFRVPAPKPYNIVDKDNNLMTDNAGKVRVFTEVSLVLFVDDNEQSLEGDPKEIALNAFNRNVEAGRYIIAQSQAGVGIPTMPQMVQQAQPQQVARPVMPQAPQQMPYMQQQPQRVQMPQYQAQPTQAYQQPQQAQQQPFTGAPYATMPY